MLLILLGFAIVVIIDLLPLLKRKIKNAIPAFLVVAGLALIMALVSASKVRVPTVVEILCDFMDKIGISYPD